MAARTIPGFHGFATNVPKWFLQPKRVTRPAVGSPAAAAAPAAPAAAAPLTLPVDPRIEAYLMQGRGTVTAANAGRQVLGTNTALGLTDSGLLERSGTAVAGQANAGFPDAPDLNNITYRIIVGPEGRLYRQAYATINGSAAQRGAGYGSGTTNARRQATTDLNNQVNQRLRGFSGQQDASLQQEAGALGSLGASIAGVRSEQAATLAATPAPPTVAAAPTPAPVVINPAVAAAKIRKLTQPIPGFHGFSTNAPSFVMRRRNG